MELEQKYHPILQPDQLTNREKEDGMGAYLMMFASIAAGLPLPIINLVASVIYYFTNRSKSRFVHFHALQSLLSQVPTSLMNAGLVFWIIQVFVFENMERSEVFFGYAAVVFLANLLYFAFSIVAAVKARKGRMYYFIFFGGLAYQWIYSTEGNLHKDQSEAASNKPPF